MILTSPYAAELLQVARKVVWYDTPEQALGDLPSFLARLMGLVRPCSPADIAVVERFVPAQTTRRVR